MSFSTTEEADKFWKPYAQEASQKFHACLNSKPQIDKGASTNECDAQSSIPTPYGSLTYFQIQSRWYKDKGGKGPVKSGPPPYVPSKKPEEPPPPVAKLVSFGKMFLTFCLPALTRVAEKEGLDDVQINFYQLNESCGPISLHSIAEFPVEITDAEQKYADECVKRGGESVSVLDFVNWANANIFGEKRSPGYGLRHIYEAQAKADAKSEDTKKDDKAKEQEQQQGKMVEWSEKYGEFKPPILTMKIDTVYAGKNNTGIDLLYKLTHRVGGQYSPPPPKFKVNSTEIENKRILRVDLYDRTYNPYARESRVFKDKDGSYQVFDAETTADQAKQFLTSYARSYAGPGGSEIKEQVVPNANTKKITIDGVSIGRTIPKGKNVLKDYVANSMPTLVVGGTNATLISKAQFSSKTDGLNAARQLAAGSYKFKSTLAPNGLSMAENNLPIRALPAELQINTIGCPIAETRQMFFIDFETGTTLDNIYAVRQITHNFTPGKYDSAWTFTFADGYAKFFGAAGVNAELRKMGAQTEQLNKAKEAAGEEQPANLSEKPDWGRVGVSEKDKPG
jgi:hypothetical protein